MVSHADVRRERLDVLKATYEKAKKEGKEVNDDKLIAQGCYEWSCSRRTMLEYIKIVKALV